MSRKIILFEANEVPYRVMDYFVAKYPRSGLAGILASAGQYTTFSEDRGHLSPWVTWPSLHRGVSNELHGLCEIGQTADRTGENYPPVWNLLAKQGIDCGVFGSLGSYPLPADLSHFRFYVPDTFAQSPETFPGYLQAFQQLNLSMVRKSGRNISRSIPVAEACRFAYRLPRLGIKAKTVAAVAAQLLGEFFKADRKVRRRTFQSALAFDIFAKLMHEKRPAFATFFTNHVASAMHRYWAATFSDDFSENRFSQDWIGRFAGEIDFAMLELDRYLTFLKNFADRQGDYQIWIASSMGQAAAKAEPIETQLYLVDLRKFLGALGIKDSSKELPSMLPQKNFELPPSAARRLREQLVSLKINGAPLEWSAPQGNSFSLDFGHANLQSLGERIVDFKGEAHSIRDFGLEFVKSEDQSNSSGYHVPEGLLLIYDPRNPAAAEKKRRERLSTLNIAPMILKNFAVPVPRYMKNIDALTA